jgi:hypothetical protein
MRELAYTMVFDTCMGHMSVWGNERMPDINYENSTRKHTHKSMETMVINKQLTF